RVGLYRPVERAIVRIVREQVGNHVMLRDVAHRHADHFKAWVILVDCLECLPSRASEAVKSNSGFGHGVFLLGRHELRPRTCTLSTRHSPLGAGSSSSAISAARSATRFA